MVILPSARKRGYADDDLLHAVEHAVDQFIQEDGMTMFVGPNRAGNLMEVGVITLTDCRDAIAHAMRPPRTKYVRTKRPRR